MSWYELTVYIHVVAAIIWVGGIMFLGIIAVPAVRRLAPDVRTNLMSDLGSRFRRTGYTLLVILILTGLVQSSFRGATVSNVLDGSFFATTFGRTLGLKLLFFILMLIASIAHDFYVGPAAVKAASAGTETPGLRNAASWLARITAVLALVVVAYAVLLVR